MAGAFVVPYIHRFLPYILGSVALGALWLVATHVLVRIDHCYIYPENFLSERTLQTIQQQLTTTAYKKSFFACRSHAFDMPAVIQAYTLLYRHPHSVWMRLQAKQPCASLNEEYLLLEDGTLVPHEAFTAHACQDIPRITVQQPVTNLSTLEQTALHQWVRTLTFDLLTEFDLTWYDHTKIIVHHKQGAYALITHAYQKISQDILRQGMQALHIHTSKLRTTKQRRWCIDMRFDKQIIVYEGGGEKV